MEELELFEVKYMRLHAVGLKRLELALRYERKKKSMRYDWEMR